MLTANNSLTAICNSLTVICNSPMGRFFRKQSSANCSSRATLRADTRNSIFNFFSQWTVFSEWVAFCLHLFCCFLAPWQLPSRRYHFRCLDCHTVLSLLSAIFNSSRHFFTTNSVSDVHSLAFNRRRFAIVFQRNKTEETLQSFEHFLITSRMLNGC